MKLFTLALILGVTPIVIQGSVVEITSKNDYQDNVMNNPKATVVQFAAEWCGVCQAVKEPFNEISQDDEFKDLAFFKVDIDKVADLSKEHNIMGVPTFLYVKNGKVVNQEIGIQDIEMFKNDMRSHMRNSFNLPKPSSEQPSGDTENNTTTQNSSHSFFDVIRNFFAYIWNALQQLFTKLFSIFS